jgi:predicted metal-dependent phosphoesterase TrpH
VQADVNCLTLLDHDTVKAVVAAGVAFLLHALKGAVKKKD